MDRYCCTVRHFHRVIETRTTRKAIRRRWLCRVHRQRWTTWDSRLIFLDRKRHTISKKRIAF